MNHEWDRVDLDDPERCQKGNHGDANQPCYFKRVLPSNYCPRHGGCKALVAHKVEQVRNYNLTKWRARVNGFADNPEIKSLREEIGIIRMLIETVVEKCNDESDLVMYSGRIQQLIQQAQKLVVDCHKLEERTGVLLDKPSILTLADSFVKIISEFIEDGDALDTIALRMVELVARIGGLSNVTSNAAIVSRAN